MRKKVEIILGPTGVGKTDFSIDRALELSSPVISCDSRQIYKEMRIGTAVPSDEQLAKVPHYFMRTVSVSTHIQRVIMRETLWILSSAFSPRDMRLL